MDHETVKLVEELVRWKLWHGQELAQQGLVVDFFAGNDWPAQEGNRVGGERGGGSERRVDGEVPTGLRPTRDSASQLQDPEGS